MAGARAGGDGALADGDAGHVGQGQRAAAAPARGQRVRGAVCGGGRRVRVRYRGHGGRQTSGAPADVGRADVGGGGRVQPLPERRGAVLGGGRRNDRDGGHGGACRGARAGDGRRRSRPCARAALPEEEGGELVAGGGRRERGDARRHQARDAGPAEQGAVGVCRARGSREGGVHAVLHVRLVPGVRPGVRHRVRRQGGRRRRR
mmetsp:Transcript_3063/g.12243  ORF Transcript_3063/g.12243 Transcript_3063/m.12243 type:complete len:204 (+) Transcript_3063:5344-5955(+)